MAIITNKDIKIMVEVEELLHNKLEKDNEIFEDSKNYDIWVKYWNMVERFIVEKKERTKIVNNKNKTIYKERHKLNNKISYLRNKKNKTEQDIKLYEELLKERKQMNKKGE